MKCPICTKEMQIMKDEDLGDTAYCFDCKKFVALNFYDEKKSDE